MNAKIFPDEVSMETTMPLATLMPNESHVWLDLYLMPWIAEKISMPTAALGSVQTSFKEIVNNVSDHSRENLACIHAQWHPSSRIIRVSISDFGIGIPEAMRNTFGDMTDEAAIAKAITYGVTSNQGGNNAGVGLDTLVKCVTDLNRGEVHIHSNCGIWRSEPTQDGGVSQAACAAAGYYPGTLVHIVLRTDAIQPDETEREDMKWDI